MTLTVVARIGIAEELDRVVLCHPHGGGLPRWDPGAVLSLGDEPGLVVTYPLCDDPKSTDPSARWSILVRHADDFGRDSAGESLLRVGARVTARGPQYPFYLVEAPIHVFVADRRGLLTLAPMIDRVDTRGERWRLHLSESTDSLSAVLSGPMQRHPSRVHYVDDDGARDLAIRTVIDELPDGASIYVCADSVTLDEVIRTTTRSRLDSGQLRLQFAESTLSGPLPAPGQIADPDKCIVTAARSGVAVSACRDEPLLHALRTAGVQVPTSCEAGICGTCETKVIEGSVEHRDDFLSEDEKRSGETVLVCVSRCASRRLVLDI